MPNKLPIPSRVIRSSDVFQTPGKRYDPEQQEAADAYNEILRGRARRDRASGRSEDAMYGVTDPRDLEDVAGRPERGLRPTFARRELQKRSEEGEYAVPGYGDVGQFLKKGGKVVSASKRADGIAKRGKTRGKIY